MCTVEGCDNSKNEAHGLCKRHYNKAVRNGEIITIPGRVGRPRVYSDEERAERQRKHSEKKYYQRKGYAKGERPKKLTQKDHPAFCMYANAKVRSRNSNLPFDLVLEEIIIPEHCPMLGIPIIKGVGGYSDNSPTLDRLIPALGYVKDNVQVISMRANRIKDNSTFEEFERMYLNWKLINAARDDPRCFLSVEC